MSRFELPYTSPFDWEGTLGFFRSHQISGVETVTDDAYSRVFRIGRNLGTVTVTHHAREPKLVIEYECANSVARALLQERIGLMFDLEAEYGLFAARFQRHPLFGVLWHGWPGPRLARGWDAFETSIMTILGQLVSVKQAGNLMQQVVRLYGEEVKHPITGAKAYLFPKPAVLAKANLTSLGTTQIRKKTIHEFSKRVAEGTLDLGSEDIDGLKEQLLEVPGIGKWSVEYIALRALGDTDAFPATDLGIKRALEKFPDANVDELQPWRSYCAVLLWKQYMELKAA